MLDAKFRMITSISASMLEAPGFIRGENVTVSYQALMHKSGITCCVQTYLPCTASTTFSRNQRLISVSSDIPC